LIALEPVEMASAIPTLRIHLFVRMIVPEPVEMASAIPTLRILKLAV
jgi:hypothetical protein